MINEGMDDSRIEGGARYSGGEAGGRTEYGVEVQVLVFCLWEQVE